MEIAQGHQVGPRAIAKGGAKSERCRQIDRAGSRSEVVPELRRYKQLNAC